MELFIFTRFPKGHPIKTKQLVWIDQMSTRATDYVRMHILDVLFKVVNIYFESDECILRR